MESFRKVRFLIILIIGVKKNRVTLRDHVIPTKYLGAIRKVDFCLAKRWCCLRYDYVMAPILGLDKLMIKGLSRMARD